MFRMIRQFFFLFRMLRFFGVSRMAVLGFGWWLLRRSRLARRVM